MELPRFYCNEITENETILAGTEAHHLASVLRLVKGDLIELFDGKGTLAAAVVTAITKQKITLEIKTSKTFPKPNRPEIIIAASFPKGERFDWMLEKLTELGIDRIVPVIFERTVKQPKNPKITDRWQNIAISSAKQCRRIFLPQINVPAELPQVLEEIKNGVGEREIIFGSLSEDAIRLIDLPVADKNIITFIGPEGGLTEAEQSMLESAGAKGVQLTDTTLRVETAAIAFAAVLAAKR